MCNDGDSTFILGLAAGLASLPSRLECSLPAEDRNVTVSPEIFIINATFILLIHGVVFSTSKKYYPPLVSNVGWLGLLSVARLGGQRALGCGGAIIVQLPNLMRHRVWTAGNHSMGGRLILLPPQGWLIVRSRLEDPWFWKAHESERYVECATDTTLRRVNRTWLDPGWIVAPIQHQFRKGSLMLEGASPLSDRSASSRKSEEVITDEPHAGKLARVVLAGLPEEGQFYIFLPNPSIINMLFMISAYDSIAMYLAIEPQSLCFYVIAASKRKSEFSTEAGSKYLILGRSIYIFPLGLCLDLLCAKSKRLVPMEIPLGLIPRLMTKVESAWRKVKIGGVEKIPFWGIPKV
ncbi:UNVERIFIED_CONTAM: NADH-ubiquinone oxidoreductase chain 2 [Sesamum calycinum]|uniref:NADH-ubiquinone oxidoreductase chain 2 n=1 Tax=Sesamum calycinum TaxID=2727403 RepID=A0AAW2JIS4_9LAMI